MTSSRPSAVERYALRFIGEAPGREPTDGALTSLLGGCAVPVPPALLEPVRRAVLALRQDPERVRRYARHVEAEDGPGGGSTGGGAGCEAAAVEAGRAVDAGLRSQVRAARPGDVWRPRDRVVVRPSAQARGTGERAGVVLGAAERSRLDVGRGAQARFVVELDEALGHGRRVVVVPAGRLRRHEGG